MKRLIGLFFLTYIVIGYVQMFAIVDGLADGFHISRSLSFLVAYVLTWIPVIGLLAGVCGAVFDWGWSFVGAGLFFA